STPDSRSRTRPHRRGSGRRPWRDWRIRVSSACPLVETDIPDLPPPISRTPSNSHPVLTDDDVVSAERRGTGALHLRRDPSSAAPPSNTTPVSVAHTSG